MTYTFATTYSALTVATFSVGTRFWVVPTLTSRSSSIAWSKLYTTYIFIHSADSRDQSIVQPQIFSIFCHCSLAKRFQTSTDTIRYVDQSLELPQTHFPSRQLAHGRTSMTSSRVEIILKRIRGFMLVR